MNLNDNLDNGNNNNSNEVNKGIKYVLITVGCGLLLLLICATCGKSDSDSSYHSSNKSPQSFEDYLKDTDPDSYEFYKGLEKGFESGTWDSENGFYQP